MSTWRHLLPRSATFAVGAAALSISYTALTLGGRAPVAPDSWVLIEPAALTALAYPAARWARPRAAVGAVAVVLTALVFMMFRFLDGLWWEPLAAGALWSIPALAATALAIYQRAQERLRERTVAEARREQRLELAHDLHDFAAHDLSEVVAQAQAGRMVLVGGSDERVAALLERIEHTGLRALGSMDRTVGLLRGPETATAPIGGLAEIPGLVERFNEAGSPLARLEDRLSRPVGRESGAVAHRLVTEALTNVRRHASGATEVRVVLLESENVLTVAVADDGRGSRPRQRASSGLGLAGLAARVEAMKGTFTAGASGDGWRVEARLPLDDFEPEGAGG